MEPCELRLQTIYIFGHIQESDQNTTSQSQWYTPIITATQEAEAGGLKYKASPGKVSETLSKKQNTDKELEAWLKWHSIREALDSIPSTARTNKQTATQTCCLFQPCPSQFLHLTMACSWYNTSAFTRLMTQS
jgi:hypothetical protein